MFRGSCVLNLFFTSLNLLLRGTSQHALLCLDPLNLLILRLLLYRAIHKALLTRLNCGVVGISAIFVLFIGACDVLIGDACRDSLSIIGFLFFILRALPRRRTCLQSAALFEQVKLGAFLERIFILVVDLVWGLVPGIIAC